MKAQVTELNEEVAKLKASCRGTGDTEVNCTASGDCWRSCALQRAYAQQLRAHAGLPCSRKRYGRTDSYDVLPPEIKSVAQKCVEDRTSTRSRISSRTSSSSQLKYVVTKGTAAAPTKVISSTRGPTILTDGPNTGEKGLIWDRTNSVASEQALSKMPPTLRERMTEEMMKYRDRPTHPSRTGLMHPGMQPRRERMSHHTMGDAGSPDGLEVDLSHFSRRRRRDHIHTTAGLRPEDPQSRPAPSLIALQERHRMESLGPEEKLMQGRAFRRADNGGQGP